MTSSLRSSRPLCTSVILTFFLHAFLPFRDGCLYCCGAAVETDILNLSSLTYSLEISEKLRKISCVEKLSPHALETATRKFHWRIRSRQDLLHYLFLLSLKCLRLLNIQPQVFWQSPPQCLSSKAVSGPTSKTRFSKHPSRSMV
jgi:hypothetical protein